MSQVNETLRGSTEPNTSSIAESNTSQDTLSPVDRNCLPIACLIPSNRPARSAIANTRKEGSPYHSRFITDIEYRGVPNTPCFELALGGLPENSGVGWRIGRGCKEYEDQGVDLLLAIDDDSVAGVHAMFGWQVQKSGFFLIILNKHNKLCTINGRDFSKDSRKIPSKNTILIGDCAFTLQYTQREWDKEDLFQTLLQEYTARLFERTPIRNPEHRAEAMAPLEVVKKHELGVGEFEEGAGYEDKEDSFKRSKLGH